MLAWLLEMSCGYIPFNQLRPLTAEMIEVVSTHHQETMPYLNNDYEVTSEGDDLSDVDELVPN